MPTIATVPTATVPTSPTPYVGTVPTTQTTQTQPTVVTITTMPTGKISLYLFDEGLGVCFQPCLILRSKETSKTVLLAFTFATIWHVQRLMDVFEKLVRCDEYLFFARLS